MSSTELSAPATPGKTETSARIVSIDILRGLVIALMALDHTRDFFGTSGFNPRDVTEPALFLTRWITHICAPTFIFLAGLSAFLYGRGRSTSELSRFLLVRGFWLILIDITLIKFGWRFEFEPLRLTAGIIFAIGASMIVLAALVWLPRWLIAAIALVMIAGHNLLDGVSAVSLGDASGAWRFLHEPGPVFFGPGIRLYVVYPLIPWIGVMAAGFAFSPVMQRDPDARTRLLLRLGLAITVGFVALRTLNIYGNPAPWYYQETWFATWLSFLNNEKYPPSLLYLMMTLGPALILLGLFERVRSVVVRWLAVFGQVPFFFYVVHIYVIHLLAVAVFFAMTGDLARTPAIGLSLSGVYLVWLFVLVLLYPVCRWFVGLKKRGQMACTPKTGPC
ncbi:MAG: DUF1624 domain-containing protein [Gammaproteobacteria bacterium]|nr:DUF1624 domain-containing protein [Gammaproteobacteria bacterium]